MQLAAWDQGVASGLYTGVKQDQMKKDFGIPDNLKATIVVGFGYPAKNIQGKKNRMPLSELAFLDKFGNKYDQKRLS
jgi:nitroreductase